MLTDAHKLQQQLATITDVTVRETYELLAHARLPNGIAIRPAGHGYIENELRYELGDRWYFSAILNKSWVLWYFRRPALRDLDRDAVELLRIFDEAKITAKGEVALRIYNSRTAYAVLGWTTQNI